MFLVRWQRRRGKIIHSLVIRRRNGGDGGQSAGKNRRRDFRHFGVFVRPFSGRSVCRFLGVSLPLFFPLFSFFLGSFVFLPFFLLLANFPAEKTFPFVFPETIQRFVGAGSCRSGFFFSFSFYPATPLLTSLSALYSLHVVPLLLFFPQFFLVAQIIFLFFALFFRTFFRVRA